MFANKKLYMIIFSTILLISHVTGVKSAETPDSFTFKPGSVLSEEYPQLTVREPSIQEEDGKQTVCWEISFNLGPNPEQWDRILVGEILADSIKRAPIRWNITDESGKNWPPQDISSAMEMNWLSPDTMGWGITETEGMSFETLRDKTLSIKLTAVLDPVLYSSEDNIEGILSGTFINCYSEHKLIHYNSSYTGAEAQNVSTALKRVSLLSKARWLPTP